MVLGVVLLAVVAIAFTRTSGVAVGRARTPIVLVGAVLVIAVLLMALRGGGGNAAEPSPTTPIVTLRAPLDATTVGRPVEVAMTAQNLGHGVHLHLIIDAPCVAEGRPIGKDQHHLHLDARETEAVLDLQPGEHTLCLEAGSGGTHRALGVPDRVTIAVR